MVVTGKFLVLPGPPSGLLVSEGPGQAIPRLTEDSPWTKSCALVIF